jgi:mannose-6-phosphate isomerase-like protein (cupin superfamily)
MPEAFSVSDTVLRLTGPGQISRWRNERSFWQPKDRPELTSGQVLSVFSYSKTWSYQERHPDGEELAIVLSGSIDVLLGDGDRETPVRLESGSGCVVPAGTWHRVAPRVTSTVLFITPVPARTEHRDVEVPELASKTRAGWQSALSPSPARGHACVSPTV